MDKRLASFAAVAALAVCAAFAARQDVLGTWGGADMERPSSEAGVCATCDEVPANPDRLSANAAAGSTPGLNAAATSDVDGNGRSDLLLSHNDGGAVAYWSMSGPDATSYSPVLATPPQGVRLAEADFSGDGRVDILWKTGVTMVMWTADAAGGFIASTLAGPQGGWGVIGAGDVDGDGKADILLQYPHDTRPVAYWIMGGPTVLRYSPPIDSPAFSTLATKGDFDGDRKLDLVWQNGPTLTMWLGDGNAFTGQAVRSIASGWQLWGSGDIDADGRSDLILTSPTLRYMAYWAMDGATVKRYSPAFRLPGEDSLARRYGPVAVGDYNGDGRLDIVHSRERSQELMMWLGDGNGFIQYPVPRHSTDWKVVRTFGVDGAPVRPYVRGDANGDGATDLLAIDSYLAYDAQRQGYYPTWGTGGRYVTFVRPGSFEPLVRPSLTDEPLATGDFDGDTKLDLVYEVYTSSPTSIAGVATLMQLSSRPMEPVGIQTPAPGWQIIGAGDVDGDGRSDLLLGEGVQRTDVARLGVTSDAYHNPSMTGFAYWSMDHGNVIRYSIGFRTHPDASRLAAQGDFNGDGKLDFVWSNLPAIEAPRLVMWTSDGVGFASSAVQPPASGWNVIAAADVQADGRSDLFLNNGEGIAYWLMSGSEVRGYSPGFLITRPELVGDFNGDGRADLLELRPACRTPAALYLHVGDGNGFDRVAAGSVGEHSAACFFSIGPRAFPR